MAISSALSFLSDRKRPIAVAVTVFIVLSSLFILFNPAPSPLQFFSSPSSHISSSETSIPLSSNASPPEAPTAVASNGLSSSTPADPVPVSGDASPPVTATGIASDGVGSSTADPPRPDLAAADRDAEADAPQPDHGTPSASADESGSAGDSDTTPGVSGERDGEGPGGGGGSGSGSGAEAEPVRLPSWELCEVGKGVAAADYIPCLDNVKAIKSLKSTRHMEHRERHCPEPRPRCLVPLPDRYRRPVPWPLSRDMIWYNNVPHPKLVQYKKDQNWVRKSGSLYLSNGCIMAKTETICDILGLGY
nr:unnamed protein product [Digitaria exilis]